MKGHRPNTRDALRRLLDIAGRLRRSQPFTSQSVAAEYGVDLKTIRRDINVLRDHLPIEWDVFSNSYVLGRRAKRPRLF